MIPTEPTEYSPAIVHEARAVAGLPAGLLDTPRQALACAWRVRALLHKPVLYWVLMRTPPPAGPRHARHRAYQNPILLVSEKLRNDSYHWGPQNLQKTTLGNQRGARTAPKAKKNVTRRGSRKGLEKGPCLEGARIPQINYLHTFNCFLEGPGLPTKKRN